VGRTACAPPTRCRRTPKFPFAPLLLELPPYLRAPVQFAHMTGWRREEVLGLTWDAIDWKGHVIRLAAKDTKGSERWTWRGSCSTRPWRFRSTR
jgi:integrase